MTLITGSFVQNKLEEVLKIGPQEPETRRAQAQPKSEAFLAAQRKDEDHIKQQLKEVDQILTRECFFCGPMLIDMIDNTIALKEDTADSQDIVEETNSKIDKEEDWDIE